MKIKNNSEKLTYEEIQKSKKIIGYLSSENEILSKDFNTSISLIVDMLPKEVSNILKNYRFILNHDEYFNWEKKVKDELVELAYQTIKHIDFYGYPEKAFCPLCEDGVIRKPKNLAEGRTLEGIKRHLDGRGRHNKCKVFELIEKNVLSNIKRNK